ncbi:MAG: putative phage terminase, small subunit [Bacilli bacterium]|nr:putative phage terminase, small subunit [Bacilli bacterium]
MGQIVSFKHMRIGVKGGGKHWTEQEVKDREEAAKQFQRKKKKKLKIPEWLNDSARKVWRKTVKDMEEFEVLDKVDEDVLAAYCDAVEKHKAANELIDVNGYTEMSASGTQVVSAYVKMSQSYARLILAYSNKLGLNSESRVRLSKKVADQEDENEDLFN